MPLVGAHWRSLALIARTPRPRAPRQGVHENIQYTTALQPWGPDEPKVSKCVFIGRGLDFEDLRKRWQKCIEPPAEEKKGFLSAAKEALLG